VHLKDRLGDVETDCRDRLHNWTPPNRGALAAPTSMALTCRWRSRPQHHDGLMRCTGTAPDKTFIGRIERGFDFLGYHFTRAGLSVARKTVQYFLEKASRLYEQGAVPPQPQRRGERRLCIGIAPALECVLQYSRLSSSTFVYTNLVFWHGFSICGVCAPTTCFEHALLNAW
jgi:hypothetical protein